MISGRYALAGIVVLALALRLAFVGSRDRPLFSDEIAYDDLARTMVTTGGYSDEGHPTAYRTIGYPAFVAGIYALAGPEPGRVRAAQAVLGAASSALLYGIAGGGAVGLWAAGIWALYPPAILYTDLLMPESLFVFVLLLALLTWTRARTPEGGPIALGALLGAMTLIKAQAVLLLAALPLAAHALGRRPTRWGLVIAGAALVLLPWIARNTLRFGRPTLVTSVGANLLIGNNPFATGGYTARLPANMKPTSTDEAVAQDQAIEEATTYIADHPGRFFERGVRSLAHLAATEGGMVVWGFHPSPGESKARLREKIREVPLGYHVAISGSYVALLLTGMWGSLAAPRSDLKAAFLALLGSWIAVHFVFYGGSRYHFPLMPFFSVFAASVLAGATGAADQPPLRLRRWGWIAYALLVAGLCGVWAGEYWVVLGGSGGS